MEQERIPLLMPSIFPVTCHTDFVGQGTTFVAISGYVDNGVKYIPLAIEKGASTIVIEREVSVKHLQQLINERNITLIRVDDARGALADLSAQAAGFPAKKLKIIGITGTKGKTTTAFLLEHCLSVAGYKVGRISSAGNSINGVTFAAVLTTPQPDYLHQFLKLCVENSVEYVVMEVAAQALTLHRVKGIQFDGVIFTNFSHEHLEFYPTMDNYYEAKSRIFDMAYVHAPIVVNSDDEKGLSVITGYSGQKKCIGYGFYSEAEYKGMYDATNSDACSLFIYHNDGEKVMVQCSSLFGHYNAYNILAAITMAHVLGIAFSVIAQAFTTFAGVPGRLQSVDLPNGARAFIDYAHNPSSFEAVLSTLRQLTDHLIVIFGAGGGKDKFKRPIMGALACRYADCVVLTADNPRLEHIDFIMNDILAGINAENQQKTVICYDREQAIHQAYKRSRKGSIIALLGKGSDEYQIIGTVKHFFSESSVLKQLL